MNTTCKRTDCRYYSTYTETCDFTLINSRARQCPAASCTEYIKREEKRTWQQYVQRRPVGAGTERFVIAGCGHEVYSGECIYTHKDKISLCPDCVSDIFNRLLTDEKAYALGYAPAKAVE